MTKAPRERPAAAWSPADWLSLNDGVRRILKTCGLVSFAEAIAELWPKLTSGAIQSVLRKQVTATTFDTVSLPKEFWEHSSGLWEAPIVGADNQGLHPRWIYGPIEQGHVVVRYQGDQDEYRHYSQGYFYLRRADFDPFWPAGGEEPKSEKAGRPPEYDTAVIQAIAGDIASKKKRWPGTLVSLIDQTEALCEERGIAIPERSWMAKVISPIWHKYHDS